MNTDQLKTWVEIDAARLLRNLNIFSQIAGGNTALMPVIKANAYGHGLAEVARLFARQSHLILGVDSIDEAEMVSKVAPRNEIMILGYIPQARRREALEKGFHISVYSPQILAEVQTIIARYHIEDPKLHLKIETGTNRLGLTLAELQKIKNFPPICGIYTHFADTDNPRSIFYREQMAILELALSVLNKRNIMPKYIHAACTVAIFQYPESHYNLVRVGIGLYGLWPTKEAEKHLGKKINLSPALTWKTRVAQIKTPISGETVGYDRTHKIRGKKKIAVLPVGYADGYDRGLSGLGEVLISGKRTKIVGRICMDMMMADVTGIPASAGDEVILLGGKGRNYISADEIAKKIGTINYEIVARINPLIPRIII